MLGSSVKRKHGEPEFGLNGRLMIPCYGKELTSAVLGTASQKIST